MVNSLGIKFESFKLTDEQLKPLQEKMREYLENGTRLGWLINRQDRKVEIIDSPHTLSGEDVLTNFLLDLHLIW